MRLYGYCLMLTHYRLCLETPQANSGRFMHSLETACTVYSNLRRQRHGPLAGCYKAKPLLWWVWEQAVRPLNKSTASRRALTPIVTCDNISRGLTTPSTARPAVKC